MAEPLGRAGWGALIAAKIVCCIGLVLLLTGVVTIGGIGAWVLGSGWIWLVLGGLGVVILVLWRHHGTGGAASANRRIRDPDRKQTR